MEPGKYIDGRTAGQRYPWSFHCTVAAIGEAVGVLLSGGVAKRYRRWTYALLIWRRDSFSGAIRERHFMTSGNPDDAREQLRGHLLDLPPPEPPDVWNTDEIDECAAQVIDCDAIEHERHADWMFEAALQARRAERLSDQRRRAAGVSRARRQL